jgi:hypothetical protein
MIEITEELTSISASARSAIVGHLSIHRVQYGMTCLISNAVCTLGLSLGLVREVDGTKGITYCRHLGLLEHYFADCPGETREDGCRSLH